MRYRLILPPRLEHLPIPKVLEKEDSEVSQEWLREKNEHGYNIYYFPNGSKTPINHNLKAKDVDDYQWVFVDMDLKDQVYSSLKDFGEVVRQFPLKPTKTIKSGQGVHVYWKISNLDRDSYMQIQKALISRFKTDDSIWTITQLMRVPGYLNTKYEPPVMCSESNKPELSSGNEYTMEQMWECLDPISKKDSDDIQKHINKYIYGIEIKPENLHIEPLPEAFESLMKFSKGLYDLFYNPVDRSTADMKIANVLYVNNFTQEEATNILMQTQKGQERGIDYVAPIVQKVYVESPPDIMDDSYDEALKTANLQRMLEQKQYEIKEYKVSKEYEKVKEAKEIEARRGSYSLKNTKSKRIEYYLAEKHKEDLGAENALPFITERLTPVVPHFGKNVILIGGLTGTGKSTSVCNITIPVLELFKKTAIISTEEKAEDIITRIAANKNGWNYANERNWSMETKNKRDEEIKRLIEEDLIVVYDSYTTGWDENKKVEVPAPDMTTMEGIEIALECIRRDSEEKEISSVILDYVSKVSTSKQFPNMPEWQVIFNTMKYIEEWNKSTQIPVTVFTQLKDFQGESPPPFKLRLPGSTRMIDLVTCGIEVKTDYESSTSTFICHKARKGLHFRKTLRYTRGKYVDCPQPDDTEETEFLGDTDE